VLVFGMAVAPGPAGLRVSFHDQEKVAAAAQPRMENEPRADQEAKAPWIAAAASGRLSEGHMVMMIPFVLEEAVLEHQVRP
jgi:hypothetical protein